MRTVSFELNGIRRDVQVPDEEAQKNIVKVPMADPEDKSQVGSSIPGAVSKLNVKVGDAVEVNQTLATIEAMKMETAITARMSGTVAEILVKEGETVKGGPAHHGHQITYRIRQEAGPDGAGLLCFAAGGCLVTRDTDRSGNCNCFVIALQGRLY